MKNRLFLLVLAMLLVSPIMVGNNAFDGTTFTISSNVSLPIYVHYSGKTLTISSYHYTTYTRIANATITDAKGNNCIYKHTWENHSGSDGNYVHHYYNITGVYSSSSSSSGSSSSSSYSGSSSASELGSNMGRAAMQMQAMERYYEDYHAGGFSLAATVSPTWGENLELRFRYGSSRLGGDVTGMVGYDWIHRQEGDKLTWSVGLGMYFGGRPSYLYLWDVDFGVKFGKSNKPYNDAWTAILDLSTTHLFGPEHVIGLVAGAGIGLGGSKPRFVWDVRGGIVIYFLQWNWF